MIADTTNNRVVAHSEHVFSPSGGFSVRFMVERWEELDIDHFDVSVYLFNFLLLIPLGSTFVVDMVFGLYSN